MPRVRPSYNLVTLFYKVKKLESAVSFLQDYGVLHKSAKCSKCHQEVVDIHQETGTGYFSFRCSRCETKVSVRDNTHLAVANIGIRTFILLTYLFVMLQGLTWLADLFYIYYFLYFHYIYTGWRTWVYC